MLKHFILNMKIKSQREFKIILGSLYVIAAIFIITYIIALSIKLDPTSASTAGSIGDTIGGLASPFIGTMGVILTFLAFWVQFEANQSQREDIRRERFENKFYELLRLHKENVNEIEITDTDKKGRVCFESFLKEYAGIYTIIDIVNASKNKLDKLDKEDISEQAYELFFFGITNKTTSKYSERNHKGPYLIDEFVLELIKSAAIRWGKDYYPPLGTDPLQYYFANTPNLRFNYTPFQGQSSNLGHYYRHIYQILKFVHSNHELSVSEKKNYIKVLRAQLSNFEQALLYLNSLWGPGKRMWFDRDEKTGYEARYLIDYKLIKNLPLHLVDFAIEPQVKYKKELKKAYPDKDESWLNETTFYAFEELENLMPY
ncbi:putative phage abortive infection protein [Roseivirga ehrenbergii]|nr:putative phage abortive infection protein [Roseivirga ehrenbergii]